jgi:formylglycine-generating enzyme required for sulfatase activity
MDAVEQPARDVRITRPFLLSKTEVTQAQWKALMGGGSPSAFKGDTLPVENVTWGDTQTFCQALHDLDAGGKYRLPTEAEWEYAARAGSTDFYGMGADKSPISTANLQEYTWMNSNSGNKTQPVGTRRPNAWGFADMQGNVWEWCQDWYSPTAYSSLPAADPLFRSPAATERVLRGGCWYLDARAQRVSLRGGNLPTYKSQYAGFRVARDL